MSLSKVSRPGLGKIGLEELQSNSQRCTDRQTGPTHMRSLAQKKEEHVNDVNGATLALQDPFRLFGLTPCKTEITSQNSAQRSA